MYQVLILDDEQLALQSVQRLVNWDQLNITRVLLASNVNYAQDLLERFHIDLIICDIEMPIMTGLEFAEKLRETRPTIEIIMLTGHMSFEYVQQALRMGCLDYLLKPATSELLTKSIEKALKRIEQKRKQEENLSNWKEMAFMRRERFIRDVSLRIIPANCQEIDRTASRLGLIETHETLCRPVLISIRQWKDNLTVKERNLFKFGISNVAQELVAGSDLDGLTIQLEGDRVLVILEDASRGERAIQRTCLQVIQVCNKHLSCDVSCYIGNLVQILQLADEIDTLIRFPQEHVVPYNQVHFTELSRTVVKDYSWDKDIQSWLHLLKQGQIQELLEQVRKILTEEEENDLLGVLQLSQLQQDFKQQLYIWLEEHNLQANLLFQDKRSLRLTEQSLFSIDQFIEWMEWLLVRAQEALTNVYREDAWIEQVKDYITLHIKDDMNRQMIANAFYVTPDYLTRSFKQKTGIGLTAYVIQQRVTLAKQLLAHTDIAIGEIAIQLGYASFSHFSKIFKESTGLTPSRYRKANQ